MSTYSPSPLLRRVLVIDAVTCLATGLLLIAAATSLARLTRLPEALLRPSSVILLAFGFYVGYLATRSAVAGAAVWFAIVANAGWVIASIGLLFVHAGLTGLGQAFVIAQAAVVALLAAIEYLGLQRSTPLVATSDAAIGDLRAR